VLQDTIERIFVQNLFADIPRGVFLVRGENVLLLGEIVRFSQAWRLHLLTLFSQDLDKEDDMHSSFQQAPIEKVHALQKRENEERKRKEKLRHVKLQAYGFEGEQGVEAIL
jgi:U6 snRNA-associated Sm-like protein LSm1